MDLICLETSRSSLMLQGIWKLDLFSRSKRNFSKGSAKWKRSCTRLLLFKEGGLEGSRLSRFFLSHLVIIALNFSKIVSGISFFIFLKNTFKESISSKLERVMIWIDLTVKGGIHILFFRSLNLGIRESDVFEIESESSSEMID